MRDFEKWGQTDGCTGTMCESVITTGWPVTVGRPRGSIFRVTFFEVYLSSVG